MTQEILIWETGSVKEQSTGFSIQALSPTKVPGTNLWSSTTTSFVHWG